MGYDFFEGQRQGLAFYDEYFRPMEPPEPDEEEGDDEW